jgi:hypothetical protein
MKKNDQKEKWTERKIYSFLMTYPDGTTPHSRVNNSPTGTPRHRSGATTNPTSKVRQGTLFFFVSFIFKLLAAVDFREFSV